MDRNIDIPQTPVSSSPMQVPDSSSIGRNSDPQITLPSSSIQGLKRHRHHSHPDGRGDGFKRPQHRKVETPEGTSYLIIHEVGCSSHVAHQTSRYLDTPRLFAGDSRATALHGWRSFLQDISSAEFLERNPAISFIVLKMYDCGHYHDKQLGRDDFQNVVMPEGVAKTLVSFKAHLMFLPVDGPEAESTFERILIVSRELQGTMRAVQARYPQYFPDTQTPDRMDTPYLGLYHARKLIKDHVLWPGSGFNEVERAHTAGLLGYVQTSRAEEYREAESQFAEGMVSKRHFSKLFAPNDVVVRSTPEGPMGYVISEFPQIHDVAIRFNCWSWEFNGKFYKKSNPFTVHWPSDGSEDTITIASLSLYPLHFDKEGLKARLHDRGQQLWACRKQRLVECDSPTKSAEFRATCNRFMVDLATYHQLHPEAAEPQQNDETLLENGDSPPEGDFLLLLPPSIKGYGFHDKKWTRLPVEYIRDVKWSGDTFDRRLVLKPQKKELIKALVTVHASTKPHKSDIIEGKGKGLILLLHGSPGTGKTLTAESIAEFAQRPLYKVTCGDIGIDPVGVEKYLESVLYIGTIWGAVLLLDEADVFLEERTPTDLQRNALVSVFLRTLEYFEGILILTSNRVGTFDEAFKSRVQLAMHYPPLDTKDRLEVWHMFFRDMLEGEERAKHEELKDKLDVLARHKLNGRQIRNVINTARQLARYRKEILAYTHIHQALEVANEFEDYITRARGHSDEEYAQAEGLRAKGKAG